MWVLSSAVEHEIADLAVTGSNPVVPSFYHNTRQALGCLIHLSLVGVILAQAAICERVKVYPDAT